MKMRFFRDRILPLLVKVWNWGIRRKFRLMAAVVMYCLTCIVVFRTGGPMREHATNYLTGEGSFAIAAESGSGFRQEFIPCHAMLDTVGIFFDKAGEKGTDCVAYVSIKDKEGNLLCEKTLGFMDLVDQAYTYIDMGIELKKGKVYYLCVDFDMGDGTLVGINACSREYELKENQDFFKGDEKLDSQMVTLYTYSDVLLLKNTKIIYLLCFLAALGIAVGPPGHKRWNFAFGMGIFIVAPPVLVCQLEMLVTGMMLLTLKKLLINIGLVYALWLMLFLMTLSLKVTVTAGTFSVFILHIVNYYFTKFRGAPFKFGELRAWKTAAKVVGNYNYSLDKSLVIALLLVVLVFIWGIQIQNIKVKACWRACGWVVCAIGLVTGVYMLDRGNMLERLGISYVGGIGQPDEYLLNGYLASTVLDIKNSRIEKPDGYTREKANEILSDYNGIADGDEDTPNIILIMNESFSDLRVLGELELSQENMQFWKSLDQNSIMGYAHASVLGGGTANSEFEVFTGCTKAFLPSAYYAYMQCMDGDRESLVSVLKRQGYRTVAMHPQDRNNWNRNQVYEFLGFEKCLWQEDFEDCEIVHSGVSDYETYKKIIEIYGQKEKNEKIFIWDLTMQNHGGYVDSSVEVDVHAENVESEIADKYLSLVKISDEAIEKLINYFEKEDEKVIICIFGDHQPMIEDQAFYEGLYRTTPDRTKEERLMSQFMTPFLIWANYDIPKQENVELSMNYLGTFLLKTAKVPCTPYFEFLSRQMERYPIITVNGWKKQEDECFHTWGEEEDPFGDYRILQYYYLFDS